MRRLNRKLLGFIFDVIVKVLNRVDIKLTNLPRMADWAQLGEIISRCLGYPDGAFLKAYRTTWQNKTTCIRNKSSCASNDQIDAKENVRRIWSVECLEGIYYFKGSMTELLTELNQIAEIELDINIKDKRPMASVFSSSRK